MHDIVKPKTVDQMQKPRNRWIKPAIIILIIAATIFGLVKLGQPMMLIVIAVVTALVVIFGYAAFRSFRSGRVMSGAIFAILAVFLFLVDMKALQFRAMGAMGAKMAPPPTTVTSAVV